MQRITASFQKEEDVNKFLEALKEAEIATESIGSLMRAKAEVIDDENQYMLVVDVDENRKGIVNLILNNAGGKSIESVDTDWQPAEDWVTRLGIDPPLR